MIKEELFNILERLQVGDQALLNAHDEVLDLFSVMQRDMLSDMIMQQEEIVSSPIRFNGVHIENIKKIFKNNGTEYQPPF